MGRIWLTADRRWLRRAFAAPVPTRQPAARMRIMNIEQPNGVRAPIGTRTTIEATSPPRVQLHNLCSRVGHMNDTRHTTRNDWDAADVLRLRTAEHDYEGSDTECADAIALLASLAGVLAVNGPGYAELTEAVRSNGILGWYREQPEWSQAAQDIADGERIIRG